VSDCCHNKLSSR